MLQRSYVYLLQIEDTGIIISGITPALRLQITNPVELKNNY